MEQQRGDAAIVHDLPRLLAEVTEEQVRQAAATLAPQRRTVVEVVAGAGGAQ
jgi:hypothetical protein